jgi:hypothetical protein
MIDKWPVDELGNPVLVTRMPPQAKHEAKVPWYVLKNWEGILGVMVAIGGFPWYTIPGLMTLGLLVADYPCQMTKKQMMMRFIVWPYYLGVYAQAKINRIKGKSR